MAGRERPADRGARLGRVALLRIGQELRDARLDRGLTVDAVAAAVGCSNAHISRIERGLAARVPAVTLFRTSAAVGLDLSMRMYPGPSVIRDAAHAELLADVRHLLHPSLRWATEVPLPIPGDQRAWDGLVSGSDWRFGVECETRPRDAQGLNRRLQLKVRDGGVDGVLLVLRDSRPLREFMRASRAELEPSFPIPGARAIDLLTAGRSPGGSSIVLVPRRPIRAVDRRPIRRG